MADAALVSVLERAQAIGLLGPGPITEHLDHARVFVESIPGSARFFIDLGSGGGIPGLVIAHQRPDLRGALLDGSTKRGAFLSEAVTELHLDDRLVVWQERAELVGRDRERRTSADVVVARSFGPPAVVAECAAPLLRLGGLLIVSDPPASADPGRRWVADGLERLGQRVRTHLDGPPAATILEQVEPCPETFPRRVGIPAKRPLF